MLPKIDLHCHLDGSLSEEVILRLAKRSGIHLPENRNDLLKKIIAPQDCQSLIQYLKCFDLPVACLQTKENLFDAAKSLILDAATDQVIYMEIRFAPLLHKKNGLTTKEIIQSVVDGVQNGLKEVKSKGLMMEAGVIICGMRHIPVKDNVQMLKEASEFLNHGVCGVDIAGDEVNYPPMLQKEFFDLAVHLNIPITIHAGECGSLSNIRDAIYLGAKRIGHGIALNQDKKTREWVKEKGIFLELCPTSNLQTKAVGTWEHYPFQLLLDEGLKVTINTDNRTVSQTTMCAEFEKLSQHFHLTLEDKKTILMNSIDAAFTTDEIKNQLKTLIDNTKQE